MQGAFGKTYVVDRDLIDVQSGDVFNRARNEDRPVFNMSNEMPDAERRTKLELVFTDYILPLTNGMLSRRGIWALAEKGDVYLLPAVRKEFERLGSTKGNQRLGQRVLTSAGGHFRLGECRASAGEEDGGEAMKDWHWVAISGVCVAIGRWVIPPGWAYTGLWLLVMLGMGIALRRWRQRTGGMRR